MMDLINATSTAIPSFMEMGKIAFTWCDYIFFCGMLGVSIAIGIYFGFFAKQQNTANEYLLGGKEMKIIPISISLVASHISGITLLAIPADVYRFGAALLWSLLQFPICGAITAYVFLPVYYKLEITSTYEYLEKRFDERCRKWASLLFALAMFLYLPIVIYIPALALAAATGLSIHVITPIICGICIFYTTIGGLKAVVWTDTIQFTVTTGSLVTVFFLGIKAAGGFSNIIDLSFKGERLDILDFDLDPFKRDSFWIISLSACTMWMSHFSANQSCVQKYLAVPTLKNAQRCVFYFVIGMALISITSMFMGLVMYAKYSECDPFAAGKVQRYDQLLPYFVMDVAGRIPGLPGLFIAGIFSAALSTLSASLNCLAGTVYEDFILKLLNKNQVAAHEGHILKILVVIIGIICTSLVYLIEKLGGILPLSSSLVGVTAGPLLALFVMGLLIPKVNRKGALYGTIIGTVLISAYVFAVQYYRAQGMISYPPKPFLGDSCGFETNATLVSNVTLSASETLETAAPKFFKISFFYMVTLAFILSVIFGLLISFIWPGDDPPVHRDLLSPVIHFMLEKDEKHIDYYSVEKALHIITQNNKLADTQKT